MIEGMPFRSAETLLPPWQLLIFFAWLSTSDAFAAPGGPIHKCATAQGLVYQDAPCPLDATPLETPRLDDTRGLAGAAPAPAMRPVDPPGDPAPPMRTYAPPPPLFRCERYDGQERYVTEDPAPRRYQVPLWTVVGDAGPAGGAYTWVEDHCWPMSPREQCAHWHERRGAIAQRRRLAFRDELARLDDELADLRARVAAHCP